MEKHILLIEDDPFLSEIYVIKFEEAGFEISVAADGNSGIQKLREQQPDLLIMDIVMPNMGGFEALRIIRKDPDLKKVPFIILSNLGEKENVDMAMELGARAYFIKVHYTPTEVVSEVKKILDAKN